MTLNRQVRKEGTQQRAQIRTFSFCRIAETRLEGHSIASRPNSSDTNANAFFFLRHVTSNNWAKSSQTKTFPAVLYFSLLYPLRLPPLPRPKERSHPSASSLTHTLPALRTQVGLCSDLETLALLKRGWLHHGRDGTHL